MSTPAPVVAPWLTQWERFPVQVYTMSRVSDIDWTITVAPGQWWRIIYITTQVTTSATVGNRWLQVNIDTPTPHTLGIPAPLVQPASVTFTYTFGPGLAVYAQNAGAALGYEVAALPDVIWPQGSTIDTVVENAKVADAISGVPQIAVEIYVEQYNQQNQPVLVPAPTLQ